jgi:hypothetical protein
MTGITSLILQSIFYATTVQQPLIGSSTGVWQCSPTAVDSCWLQRRPIKPKNSFEQRPQLIAAPDNFNPDLQFPSPSAAPEPAAPVEEIPEFPTPAVTPPTLIPKLTQPKPAATPEPAPEISKPAAPSLTNSPPRLTREADQIAAKRAWKYFERNWNPQTGLVNSVDNLPWTTLWDQGSALLGIHAARQLGLLPATRFQQRLNTLLQTLETLPLPATGLPNKAYNTRTAQMRQLNDSPDPKGRSGWSALDMARFLLGLHVLRTHYPEYSDRINRIVTRWKLSQLVKDGWLQGGIPEAGGQIRKVQEGRLGYEQYAAHSLKLWNIEANNALNNPPVKSVQVDGIALQVDQRNLSNSGATNYLTNDPYLLWGLELGWPDDLMPQVQNLLKAQAQRFHRTGILTAVNEDSLNRPPYFLYYNVYANGQPWQVINTSGKTYPQLRFLSTKAAFSWFALMSGHTYTKLLRDFVQNLAGEVLTANTSCLAGASWADFAVSYFRSYESYVHDQIPFGYRPLNVYLPQA